MGYPELLIAAFVLGIPALILYAVVRAGVRSGIEDSRKRK